MIRRELNFEHAPLEAITLESIELAAGMAVVDVAHAGWPLGLLSDQEGNAWGVSAIVPARQRTLFLKRTSLSDLSAEMVRLFGPWIELRHQADDLLPGLDLTPVATITMPSLSWPIVVDVSKAVRVLASTPNGLTTGADSGMVLRRLETGGALLRSDP